ncbi:reverse transcriptase domain-containing protein [Tanacetum coccineum]
MKFPNVPSTSVKLMLFPFSLEGAARIWLEKEPPRSIQTWDDLVSKFINKFFPPSKTSNLRNEITRFQQRFDETFYEAWDRFNDLLRACPHHGFSELHQLDTFYNALNSNDQDSLNSAAGGNFLDKMPRDCLRIIESKSKVRNSRNKPVVAKVSSSTSTPGISSEVAELKDMVKALLLDKKNQSPAPTPVKAVEESCVTCGGAHSYQTCPATTGNVYRDNIQEYVSQAAAANYNQGNTGYRAPISNQIRPPGFPPVVQPPAYQAPAYQAPAPQIQGVSKEDFQAYVKANDAVMRNMQTQDFEPDPRVPLILGRSFLKTSRALIDVYEGEITLRVGREAITFNLDQTSRYTANYNHMTANRIDVIDMACEEYSQEVLGFSNVISSGNPTPYYDPIVSTSSLTLTPFGDSDFLLFEEADSFLAIEDDPTSPEVDPTYYDPDGDILLLEAILNSDPSPPPPNQGNYFPETRKDLKICEATMNISVNSPEVELKDLPPHLEYAFLRVTTSCPHKLQKN